MSEPKYQKKPKIFIMGLSSFVGYHLARHLRKKFTVVGCYFHNAVQIPDVHAFPMNLRNDTEMLERLLALQAPDFAIGAVGIFNPKLLIDNPKVSENINITLPTAFSLIATRNHVAHVLLSCSEVFDGKTGNYDENTKDFTNHGVGKMRATAEAYMRAQTMEGTIVRAGRILGPGHHFRLNFLDQFRFSLQQETMFHANESRFDSYLSISSFCQGMERLFLNPFPANKQRVIHFGGPKISEYEMCQVLTIALGLNGKYLKLQSGNSESDYSLNCKATESTLGWKEEDREQFLKNVLHDLRPGLNSPQHHLKVTPKSKTVIAKTKTNKPAVRKNT